MPRWEPNARERLVTAAMELFEERGYDQTAVADIAARAGLTERTFFNCFPDKREVLFYGAEKLEGFLVEQAGAVPTTASAMETVSAALDAVARASDEWAGFADFARRRQALLQVHAELRERELSKLAALGGALASALRRRGLAPAQASLAAEVGIAVFKVAFDRCMSDPRRRKLAAHLHTAMAELAALELGSSGTEEEKARSGRKAPV